MQDHSTNAVYEYVRKGVAVIVGAMLFLGVLFSNLYVAEEFVHDCTGEECPICQTIAECEAFVNRISTGLIVFAVALLAVLSVLKTVENITEGALLVTLVSEKVRLNN
ncbi:MAG: hypothetical protein IJ260_02265 [Butyrivibrio sp.]|nr:hypothetical protein [Butyrivibrio sp.]MBQ8030353.1 hypothetical protein [Butyrivibrio sp.]MBR1640820.1 hypothetical protein [Butyrivibrio sp.]